MGSTAAVGGGSCRGTGGRRWSLRGMTALVTGGTRGIGRAVVEELAELGASVHTCARNEADLDDRLRQWKASGLTRVTGTACDVASRADREKLVEVVSSIFGGKLNILVNNAGMCVWKTALEHSAEEVSAVMATNVEASFHLCQLAHPLLTASGRASIVFVSSVAGMVALQHSATAYAASKGAVEQMTRSLACEWAKDGIRANCVAPWMIWTSSMEPTKRNVRGRTCCGRLCRHRQRQQAVVACGGGASGSRVQAEAKETAACVSPARGGGYRGRTSLTAKRAWAEAEVGDVRSGATTAGSRIAEGGGSGRRCDGEVGGRAAGRWPDLVERGRARAGSGRSGRILFDLGRATVRQPRRGSGGAWSYSSRFGACKDLAERADRRASRPSNAAARRSSSRRSGRSSRHV